MMERFPFTRCRALAALAILVALVESAPAGDGWNGGAYAGVFAGGGRAASHIVDRDGFSNWGRPGSSLNYGDSAFLGGALIGQRFTVAGLALRVEVDATFGKLAAASDGLDPRARDETAATEMRWMATARAGIEQALGPATLFASGGLAAGRIVNAVTDLDRSLDASGQPTPWHVDADDSFRDGNTRIGWTLALGVEAPLADAWALRLEGVYVDFGSSTHISNRSGDNRCCGNGTPRRPVSYRVDNHLAVLRLALIRSFD